MAYTEEEWHLSRKYAGDDDNLGLLQSAYLIAAGAHA